jgi:hypothetical protein
MCDMIVERKKNENLDQIRYDDSKDGGEEVNSKKKKYLYCLILTFFFQELCPFVSHLGTNPPAVELGAARFLHEPIYNKLVSVYNDHTNASLK